MNRTPSARTTMTKEVTHTNVKLVKIEMIDNEPVATNLPDEIIIGNVNMQTAQTRLSKKYDFPITVMSVKTNTIKYKANIIDFIKIAKPIEK